MLKTATYWLSARLGVQWNKMIRESQRAPNLAR